MHPKVSVILPVYNGERFLNEAIQSIIDQTFSDFELIIIDDASSDSSIKIIRDFQQRDVRIRLLRNEKNLGIAEATNIGIENSIGEFIALADQDDLNMPDRISRQVSFLNENPTISVVGSNTLIMLPDGSFKERREILQDQCLIRWFMLFNNQVRNPTVMMRADIFSNSSLRYDNYMPMQDYEFWMRINLDYWFSNLPENLVIYRIHENNASKKYQRESGKLLHVARVNMFRTYFGMEYQGEGKFNNLLQPENTEQTKYIAEVILRWQKMSMSWKCSCNIQQIIAKKTRQYIREIWHYQKRCVALLPFIIRAEKQLIESYMKIHKLFGIFQN